MNYTEAINYLLSLNKIPHKKYLKDKRAAGIYLKRIGYLLKLLNYPEKNIPHYIHITGTSGKGSVSIMLESILRASGKITGLITSPHPSAITERWAINGREITSKKFANLVQKIKPAIEKYSKNSPYDFLSFFEIVTAMGFLLFAEKKIKWAIIEVGLGGKNDSTNIMSRKDVAVITNIGHDHLKLIGPTLTNVAREKVGIIKNGCAVFTAEEKNNIIKIIKKECIKQHAKLNIIKQPKFKVEQINLNGLTFIYKNKKYFLPAIGEHQIKNAILAIEIAHALKIKNKDIKNGLAKIKLPLRMEVISKKPIIILDGAHNEDKIKTTVETIKNIKFNGNIILLVGFSADKDIDIMLKKLCSLKPTTIICAQSTINPLRQMADPKLLQKKIQKFFPIASTKIIFNPNKAFIWARQKIKPNDLLLITGSFFLSGEIRKNIFNN